MLAILHIFAVGFEHARGCAGLRKNISQHFQIETERGAKRESFGQSSRVDVHHHIDERFNLRRFARFTDKAHDCTKLFQDRLGLTESLFASTAH